jgi:hypothetical protein
LVRLVHQKWKLVSGNFEAADDTVFQPLTAGTLIFLILARKKYNFSYLKNHFVANAFIYH